MLFWTGKNEGKRLDFFIHVCISDGWVLTLGSTSIYLFEAPCCKSRSLIPASRCDHWGITLAIPFDLNPNNKFLLLASLKLTAVLLAAVTYSRASSSKSSHRFTDLVTFGDSYTEEGRREFEIGRDSSNFVSYHWRFFCSVAWFIAHNGTAPPPHLFPACAFTSVIPYQTFHLDPTPLAQRYHRWFLHLGSISGWHHRYYCESFLIALKIEPAKGGMNLLVLAS